MTLRGLFVLGAVLLVVLAQVSDIAGRDGGAFDDGARLSGPDGYMRLLQAERLWQTGDWYDRTSPLTNYPDGEVLHWTRPFDALLLAGAMPLAAAADLAPRDALLVWGSLLSPVLQVLTALVLLFGTRRWLGDWGAFFAVALFCLGGMSRAVFLFGRPDHHSLQLVLFAVGLVLLLRLAATPDSRRVALAAGAAAGAGLWVSVEGLIPLGAALAGLGLLWWVRGGAYGPAVGRYLWGLAAATAGALLVERPPADWLAEVHDRLSIVHVVLTTAMAAGWTIVMRVRRSRHADPHGRLSAALAAAAMAALVMAGLYPKFFQGPFADVDPRMWDQWERYIKEAQPFLVADWERLALLSVSLGGLAFALPWALRWLRRGTPEQHRQALFLLGGMALLLPFALARVRFAPYLELTATVPWAGLLAAILTWERRWPRLGGREIPLRVPVFGLALFGPWLVGSALAALAPEEPKDAPRDLCPWAEAAPWLRSREHVDALLTYVHQGPEVVWRTGLGVVGSPYQRNAAGVLDTHRALGGTDMARAREILNTRGIDLVVLCRNLAEGRRYADAPDSLHQRALRGEPPAWLMPVDLPPGLAETFVVLRPLQSGEGRVETGASGRPTRHTDQRRGAGAVERGGLENR